MTNLNEDFKEAYQNFEVFTVTLKHSIIYGKEEHEIEDPIIVKYLIDRTFRGGSSIVINEMMDKLKHELLMKYKNSGK